MERFRNPSRQGGFTLIEMAIVLVIIGLIIGAVLKGQDLIQNARAKKFANFVRSCEVAQWNWLDRKGHFNGDDDANPDGYIDSDVTNSDWENFQNAPENTILLGSSSFGQTFGYNNASSPDTQKGNFIAVTRSDNGTIEDKEEVFFETFDSSIDGTADGEEGVVYCVEEGSPSGIVTSAFSVDADCAADITSTLLYFFD